MDILLPESASTISGAVDRVFFVLMAISALFMVGIAATIVYFSVRYRRGTDVDRHREKSSDLRLELLWTLAPLGLGLVIFVWAAQVYFDISRPPGNSLDIYVVGQQWMWKVQHPDGQREINEVHVPVGRPIKLTMISQDVIHSFWVPAFRVKQDVLPGRYTSLWFEATKTGEFPLRCAEYCGTQHAAMIGDVIVMEPDEYQEWLSGGAAAPSLAGAGEQLFDRLGCNTCHLADGSGRGPSLVGLFGRTVTLQDGQTITADQTYIRESILRPQAQIVAGYEPIMPTFEGRIDEDELLALINYIQSLEQSEGSAP